MAHTENNRWKTTQGPMMVEYVHITSDGTDDDTVQSLLQRPITVALESVNTDLAGTADPASATLSGKTATLRDPNSQDYLVKFVGF